MEINLKFATNVINFRAKFENILDDLSLFDPDFYGLLT